MRARTTSAASAASDAASNVEAVGAAARDLLALIARSGDEVAAAKAATEQTVDDLARTDRTVRSLAAAERIGTVVKLIESIAAQTSLLALKCHHRGGARGAAGRGFAVVASEVKTLAQQTAKATSDIGGQIRDIQHAVDETVTAIAAVSTSVTTMSNANRALTGILDHQAVEIDRCQAPARRRHRYHHRRRQPAILPRTRAAACVRRYDPGDAPSTPGQKKLWR